MIIKQGEIRTRDDFGQLLNSRGLTGRGVEVGTHRGEFAFKLLETWKGNLLCVDPWDQTPPEYAPQAKYLWGGGDRKADKAYAEQLLSVYGDRVTLLQETSEKAAWTVEDGTLDFVYLDGSHEPIDVGKDIFMWWARLKVGGVLAGHDIVMPHVAPEDAWDTYIQPAVFTFATHRKLPIYLVSENGQSPWSYYLEKLWIS